MAILRRWHLSPIPTLLYLAPSPTPVSHPTRSCHSRLRRRGCMAREIHFLYVGGFVVVSCVVIGSSSSPTWVLRPLWQQVTTGSTSVYP
jgi:hypothetical protein